MRSLKKPSTRLLATLLTSSLIVGVSPPGLAIGESKQQAVHPFDAQSLLVKFKTSTKKNDRVNAAHMLGATFKDKNSDGVDDRFRNIAGGKLAKFTLPQGKNPQAALKQLKNNPNIEYAEYNYKVYPNAIPSDTEYSNLWGMTKIGAEQAWDLTIGDPSVVVGIIDTGFDYNHPDLIANIWNNPGEIAGNGIDDDGNGYIDDIHGISAINNNGDPMDTGSHGTHVSGTIGATGNNAEGVVGVNWQTSMVGCSFLGAQGGNTADGIECINYMVGLRNAGINVRVLNNSWGGGGFSQALMDAIVAANNANILFVAAAGNNSSNNDMGAHYPSNYDVANVMSIASTTSTDAMSSFSNFGSTTVDMGAPGSAILSTVPNNMYASFNGTSMATPHVAGAAALMLAANPALTTAELKSFLMESGDPITALNGNTVSGKRLNVNSAISISGGAGPNFYLGASPSSATINQGMSTSYVIDMNGVGGYTGSANMSATATPALNAVINFTPNPVAAGSSATMTVTTDMNTTPGTYTVTVTGVDGPLTKTTNLILKVWPHGTVSTTINKIDPKPIFDNESAGINSVINVPHSMVLTAVDVSVDISHTYIGDLVVTLTSPGGIVSTLHNRAGGGVDYLVATFSPAEYELENAMGDWTLNVSDHSNSDTGALNNWSLKLTGAPTGETNFPPSVAIGSPSNLGAHLNGESISFNASAIDTEDGDLSSNIQWSSNIDGILGSGASLSRNDLSVGNHLITASTTDSNNQQGSQSVNLSVANANTSVFGSSAPAMPMPESGRVFDEIYLDTGVDIDALEVSMDITFNSVQYLNVWLQSPSGTLVKLVTWNQFYNADLVKTFSPVEFAGQSSMGIWRLYVEDTTSYTMNGMLNNWSINLSNGNAVLPPANTAPTINITSPTGGSSFNQGDLVSFNGNASDVEDGNLSASLSWSSSLDGPIGNGAVFSTTALSIGSHVITASATDSGAMTGSAAVSLTVNQAPTNQPPIADFSFVANLLAVSFSDLSGDTDGSITVWLWDFGDGSTSSLANPGHSYSAAGSYQVTLTVTDNDGATHTSSQLVTVTEPGAPVSLSASATVTNNRVKVNLNWSGAKSNKVDIYRDGVMVKTTGNDGSHEDSFRSSAANFIYQVCEKDSAVCSDEISIAPAVTSIGN